METILLPSLSALLVAALFAVLTLPRWGWLRRNRGDHRTGTPRFGGISVAFSVMLTVLAVGSTHDSGGFGLAVLCGGLGMVMLGIADDVWGLRAHRKLWAQMAIALFLFSAGVRIDTIPNLWGGMWTLSMAGSLVVTTAWIVGVTNAMNLIDGLDGLAGTVGLIAACAFFALAALTGRVDIAILSAAIAGTLAVFLRYNWRPATLTLGDSGSLFLGYALAIVGLETLQGITSPPMALAPVVILAVPLCDTGFAVVRRLWNRRSPLQRDRGHIHHRLVRIGFTPVQAVLFLGWVGMVCALSMIAYALTHAWEWVALCAAAAIPNVWVATLTIRRRRLRRPLVDGRQSVSSPLWPGADPS